MLIQDDPKKDWTKITITQGNKKLLNFHKAPFLLRVLSGTFVNDFNGDGSHSMPNTCDKCESILAEDCIAVNYFGMLNIGILCEKCSLHFLKMFSN